MEPNGINELKQRLDILIALNLCQLERRTDPAEIIAVFARMNIETRDISAVLNMTPNAVRVARHRLGRSPKTATGRRQSSKRRPANEERETT